MSNIWATRIANQPVMVVGHGADWLKQHIDGAAVASATLDTRLRAEAPVMQDNFWPTADSWLSFYRPYNVQGGTLFVPVKGMLVHDYGYVIGDWLTGYTYIAKAFERGMADPDVKRIAMVISSGGGEVAGNFDLVDKLFAYRGQKPIQAFVNEAAYSAAYSLASVADIISMTRTAGVGSIGVVTAHMDMSAMMEKVGVKITFIYAGDHKVDGNAYTALPEDVKKRMQARIDSMYDIFVSTVARNRGLDEKAVRDTEALTFSAADALTVGLADEVLAFDEAVAAFSGELTTEPSSTIDNTEEDNMFSQEDLDKARAEGLSAGKAEGATAERARVKGILTAEAATNRREVAFHLALNTNQTVEEATGLLEITPEKAEAPAAAPQATGATAFEEAMAQNNPNIKAGGDDDSEITAQSDEEKTLAEFRQVMGKA